LGSVHPVDPAGIGIAVAVRVLHRELGLADPAHPGERSGPDADGLALLKEPVQLVEVVVAADEIGVSQERHQEGGACHLRAARHGRVDGLGHASPGFIGVGVARDGPVIRRQHGQGRIGERQSPVARAHEDGGAMGASVALARESAGHLFLAVLRGEVVSAHEEQEDLSLVEVRVPLALPILSWRDVLTVPEGRALGANKPREVLL
jgi:hypothetical protein